MFVNEERAVGTRVFTYFLNGRKRKNNSYGWLFRNLRQNGAEFILSRGIITETRNGSFIAGPSIDIPYRGWNFFSPRFDRIYEEKVFPTFKARIKRVFLRFP